MYSSRNSEEPELASSDAGRDGDGTTRERVLQLVVEEGPISAAALGRRLDLTAAAVRRHLDAMAEQGIVEIKNVTSRRKGAGRPSRRYVISQRGQEALGDDYLSLTRRALDVLGDSVGEEAPRALAAAYFADHEERYREQLAGVEDLDERTEKLAELFNADGFAGFTRKVGRDNPLMAMQSTQLCQGHCPVREIAEAHPVFCEEETEMISRLLEVDVRRLSTQASGAHVCTTHVPVGRERLAAEQRARRVASEDPQDPTSRPASAGPRLSGGGRKRIVISPRQQERLS
ncbi:helix-turn-helix transcriptional regulator [Nesterenkonia sp. HG001]|uniref:helix-turn-helix transcriptional regulator n=1 Tax=Nesterenkonia sp. HG001 TaxID=2983207 RepID=UPI002AC6A189|nr:helix-turn-helix domain-containing protein [Nesterenkonia sp. HG001]MDZ5078348.1 winged helix-turn-helix transcriptional regulator [Nesterenkonia sp. HG001]